MKVLVVYESKYGQSAKIADRIAASARDRGCLATTTEVSFAGDVDFAAQDAIFVVAPVYFSRHPKSIRHFVTRRAALLSMIPGAFVSVSGAAGSPHPEARAEPRSIAEALCRRAGWRPTVVATVGGAMAYPRYNWFLRAVMKRISARKGGPTDTSRVHETTNWKEVDDVVDAVLAELPAGKASDHTRASGTA